MWAVEQKHPEAVKVLLAAGADPPLSLAAPGLPRNYMANRVNHARRPARAGSPSTRGRRRASPTRSSSTIEQKWASRSGGQRGLAPGARTRMAQPLAQPRRACRVVPAAAPRPTTTDSGTRSGAGAAAQRQQRLRRRTAGGAGRQCGAKQVAVGGRWAAQSARSATAGAGRQRR